LEESSASGAHVEPRLALAGERGGEEAVERLQHEQRLAAVAVLRHAVRDLEPRARLVGVRLRQVGQRAELRRGRVPVAQALLDQARAQQRVGRLLRLRELRRHELVVALGRSQVAALLAHLAQRLLALRGQRVVGMRARRAQVGQEALLLEALRRVAAPDVGLELDARDVDRGVPAGAGRDGLHHVGQRALVEPDRDRLRGRGGVQPAQLAPGLARDLRQHVGRVGAARVHRADDLAVDALELHVDLRRGERRGEEREGQRGAHHGDFSRAASACLR
jgi:hypothetical protein